MKIKNLFYVSLAALSLAACSKDEAPVPEAGITFNLTSTGSMTKAVNTASVGAEATIQNATVYLYETTTGKAYSSTINPNAATGNVTVAVPAGTYSVAAVANFDLESTSTTSLDALKGNSVALSANSKDKFVMYGNGTNVTVTAGQIITDAQEITVSRLASAIQLGTFTFDIPAEADAFYVNAQKNGQIAIKSVMLEKSIASIKLGGGADGTATVPGVVDKTLNPFMNAQIGSHAVTAVKEKQTIVVTEEGEPGVIKERVYGYPATFPILSIMVAYGTGSDVRERYYSIDLSGTKEMEKGLVANYLYTINATITGIGSGDGGSDKKDAITKFSVKTQSWLNGNVINGGSVAN